MPIRSRYAAQFQLLVALITLAAVGSAAQGVQPPYLNPSLPIDRRVDDLISRLTLEEKVWQLQDNSHAIPRLNIPAYTWGNEGLHGDAFGGYSTLFPQVVGMAATWDQPLVHSMAEVISDEARAKYNQANRNSNHARFQGITFWAPNINIFRDPRWGRGQETYGEDPVLTSRMAVAYITGLQGDDPHYLKALAGPKHFAVHSGPEGERHHWDSYVSAHDLQDTYLPAFHAAIAEAHAGSIMCAYNRINGTPSCANPWLLTKTLRQQWDFKGFVISDCGAVGEISKDHHYAADDEHSSALAIKAGLDSACDWVPDGQRPEYSYLLEAAQHHLVSESEIDQALRRVLTMRFRLGMFDPEGKVPFSSIPMSVINSPASAGLALRAARESIVLLKNDGEFLPLKDAKSIAVIGPSADLNQVLEGTYYAVPVAPVTPLVGIQKRFSGKAQVLYAQGSNHAGDLPIGIAYTTLHPPAGTTESQEFGLHGEYFANPDLTGNPAVTRIDRTINFDWNEANPVPELPNENYSVRWTGTFTPPAPGDYRIGARGRGCTSCNREFLKLYIDGKLVLQQGESGAAKASSTGVPLPGANQPEKPFPLLHVTDLRPHTIRLEYSHRLVPTHHLVAGGIDLLWQPPPATLLNQAVAIARKSDVAVVFVGLTPGLEGEELSTNLPGFLKGDRTDLNLPGRQLALLRAVASTGKPIVVVLMTGSAVSVRYAQEHAKAVLEAWYPGQAGGTAIAETLAGDNNPAGRLPVTFYADIDQLPPFGDYNMKNRTYRYFSGKPEFGFGFGLSYSSFSYSAMRLSAAALAPDGSLTAAVHVKNTSNVAGDEVVELYLIPPALATNPLRKLVGFTRIHLDSSEEQTVHFQLTADDAQTVTGDGSKALLAGEYRLVAAGAQPQDASSLSEATFIVR